MCNTYFWAWLHFCLNKRLFLHFGTNCSYIIFFCLIFLLRQDMYHHQNPPHPPLLCDIIIYIFIEKGLFPTYSNVDLYFVVCLNCLLITISRLWSFKLGHHGGLCGLHAKNWNGTHFFCNKHYLNLKNPKVFKSIYFHIQSIDHFAKTKSKLV